MQTQINGRSYVLDDRDPDLTAVEVIRRQAGLTGTKLVCGAGVCGACTVLVDGVAVNSCLLPATALADRSVETIEAHAEPHPVQKAFMACDALQCGFCTPGFINESIAFYARWRAANPPGARPSRDEIAAALAGHLCRCGAYPGIYEAVARACAGEFDQGEVTPPRLEARAKVTGQAKYTVDVAYPGQLEGRILRSPYPHAEIRAIDTSAALALPGVKAIVDMLEGERVVRYVGQEIAAVAAESAAAAERALHAITVEYEVRPAVIGLDAARAADAPQVYPGRKRRVPSAAEGVLVPGR